MDIGLLSVLRTPVVDFHRGLANAYAKALREAMNLHDVKGGKKQNYFLSARRGMEDKLYIGNIHRIENRLYWNDEELADDDQIVNVVWVDGPITRDGGACSYGTKDMRDQVMYANTIPQVVGHLFYINTPGGEASARNDYEMMIEDSRRNGKVTVAFVDGLCASSGVNLASRCDRVVVMNQHDEYGCIGSMAAFWATPDGAIDRDGSRYVEIVGDDSPEKNAWWREAARGEYDKLQALVNKGTQEFHQSVRENRPLVKDWMLTGEIFEAKDLIPALVDEIGDYNRAIECVFALASEEMQAARFAVEEPGGEAPGTVTEPEEMAKLNAEQKAAVNTSKGDLMMIGDGHVTTSVETLFRPETVEVATPKNNNDMPDEENKVQEAVAAEAPQTTETPAQETEAPAQEEQEEAPATEEQTAAETEAQAESEETTVEAGGATTVSDAETTTVTEENPAEEEAPAEEKETAEEEEPGHEAGEAAEETPADAQADLAKVTEALHSAESLVAEKDGEIAELKQELEDARMAIGEKAAEDGNAIAQLQQEKEEISSRLSEKDAAIEKLKKQVDALKAEVKELSEKPTPMATAESGVPAGNGTGDAPSESRQHRITSDMSYEEILAFKRAQREAARKK